jgi:trk system potassium uptake protein TrkA
MNIIIVGCGRMGAELAYRLYQQGHQVAIIDQAASAFDNLHPDFRGRTMEGDVLTRDLLRRIGIEQADGLAAVTNSDTLNAVVAHVARTVYQVPNVVVRNYDARWRQFHEAFGLQVVSSTIWAAQRLEELLYQSGIQAVFSTGNGEVQIYEITIPETWHGRTLQELLPEEGCIPAALSRAGQAMLPARELHLKEGDILFVSATLAGNQSICRQLEPGKER